MKKSFKITIPEPCHENWATMTQTEKGRHCASCQKEVIDFTSKSDKELAYLVQSNSNICGRMRIDQVDREIMLSRKQKRSLPSYAAALLIPLAIGTTHEVQSQSTQIQTEQTINSTIQTPTRPHIVGKIMPQQKRLIKGIVADPQGNILGGATITIKGTDRAVRSNFDGNYEIWVSPGETLIYSYIGYKALEIKITSQKSIRVTLENEDIMGDVIIEVMGGLRSVPSKH